MNEIQWWQVRFRMDPCKCTVQATGLGTFRWDIGGKKKWRFRMLSHQHRPRLLTLSARIRGLITIRDDTVSSGRCSVHHSCQNIWIQEIMGSFSWKSWQTSLYTTHTEVVRRVISFFKKTSHDTREGKKYFEKKTEGRNNPSRLS